MKIISNQRKSSQAFTLIEMIGVLAVIAILASMLIPKIFEAINNSKINNAAVSYNTVKTALADHYAKWGSLLSSNGTVYQFTLAQAQRLDDWLQQRGGAVSAAVYLEVPRDDLVARLVSRGQVSQRDDDRAGVADRRVDVFLEELPPVLEHYAARGLLRRIDGTPPVDRVHDQVIQALENRMGTPDRRNS